MPVRIIPGTCSALRHIVLLTTGQLTVASGWPPPWTGFEVRDIASAVSKTELCFPVSFRQPVHLYPHTQLWSLHLSPFPHTHT